MLTFRDYIKCIFYSILVVVGGVSVVLAVLVGSALGVLFLQGVV